MLTRASRSRFKNRLTAPLKVFFRIGFGTWKQMKLADVQLLAGSLAFTTVISLVPLLAVSLSVFHALGGFEKLMPKIEPFILNNFVSVSGAEVSKFINTSIKRIHSGALGIGGVIGLLFASTKLFLDMERAIQRVWQEENKRSFFKRVLVYWVIMFLGPLVAAAALGLAGSKDLGLIQVLPRGSLAFSFTLVGFFAIYKWVPSCVVRTRSAFLSAALAAVAIAVAQTFYAQITRKVLSYSKIYGSFASIPIFLIWILVLWWICLGGVALTATIDKEFDHRSKT